MEINIEEINERRLALKEIDYGIKSLRIKKELEYHKQEIEKNTPKIIGKNDGFFSQLNKEISNGFNNSTFEKHKKLYYEKNLKLSNLIDESKKENISIIDSIDHLKSKIKKLDLGETDKYGIASLDFVMSIILDKYCDYEANNFTYPTLSYIFGVSQDFFTSLEKNMSDIYIKINNDKKQTLKKSAGIGLAIGAIFLLITIPPLIGGLAASGAVTTQALGSLFFSAGMAESVLALSFTGLCTGAVSFGLTYATLNGVQKSKIKEEFSNLDVDQTAISLVKTILILRVLNSYNNETDAKKIYDDYMEQYIDLKTDLDIRLFIGKQNFEINAKKNELFHNADNYLKNSLNFSLS